jgi:hypothetical protein
MKPDDDAGLAGARSGVRADVMDELPAQAAQLAGLIGRQLELDHGSMSLSGRGAVLASGGDPAHRLFQAPGGERGEHFLWENASLRAEAAANVFGENANLRLVDAERRCHCALDPEHALRRGPHLDPACVGVRHCCNRAGFHRGARNARRRESDLRRDAVGRECG